MVRFTSDHGNMLAEHGKMNKGRPYRGAAGIPFIIRYPGTVPSGKIIKTAYSSIDFAPSILKLMNVENNDVTFDGIDFTDELLNEKDVTNNRRVRFTFDTGKSPVWAAAISQQYKLVVSGMDVPWLFDLDADPYEIRNFFDEETHIEERDRLLYRMFTALKEHNIPLSGQTNFMFWNTPDCIDSRDRIDIGENRAITCDDLDPSSNKCSKPKFKRLCPVTCGVCCQNSDGKDLWVRGELRQCSNLNELCSKSKVQAFCPGVCSKQTDCSSSNNQQSKRNMT